MLHADVKTSEKTQVAFGGMLGRMVNMFGGKAAREGVETAVALKGDRKLSRTGDTGQIVDLGQEKVYDLDFRHRTYKVTTFAELRQQMEEARKRAEQDAAKENKQEQKPAKEYETDFDAKETGQHKTINGFECREVIATVTVREKGKTLEAGGGMVLTDDMWLTPTVPAMKEVADFNVRYYRQLAGPHAVGVSSQQMAMAAGMFPGHRRSLQRAQRRARPDRRHADRQRHQGRVGEEPRADGPGAEEQDDDASSGGGRFGGMFGGLAKKLEKKAEGGDKNGNQPRTTAMTTHNEVLSVSTSVGADDVAIPAGFKEKH